MPQTTEEKKEYDRIYRIQNKDRLNKQKREYRKNNKKIGRISQWKARGVICDDYDLMYEYYINTKYCSDPTCNVELTEDKIRTETTRCLDHDHHTGEFRDVLCHNCNIKRRF